MTRQYLAAYTGPTPSTGYVGYVNISLAEDDVVVTVRPESKDGGGAAVTSIPVVEALPMLEHVVCQLKALAIRQIGPASLGAE
jgi:hypothetical protein